MQVQTEITADELSQAIGLNRPANYWQNVLQANGLALALLVGILWADVKRQMAGKHVPAVSWALLLIPVLLIWFYWYRKHSDVRRAVSKPSNTPGSASVDANGISSTTSTGAPSFVPWSEYSGWKEGKDVFTLTKGKSFNVVTKRGLNEADVEQLRSLFRSQIR
jgi:YcxB-like protein